MGSSSKNRVDPRVRKSKYIPNLKPKYLTLNVLSEIKPKKNPFVFFNFLFKKAIKTEPEPNAATLCTDGPNGRMVLIKSIDKSFYFFTNKHSQKVKELKRKPRASLVFYWPTISVQIRVHGFVSKLPRKICVEYFSLRPLESQLALSLSKQSKVLDSWYDLKNKFQKYIKKIKLVPTPAHWCGYEIKPQKFEFWFGSTERLHRRFLYKKSGRKWYIKELYP